MVSSQFQPSSRQGDQSVGFNGEAALSPPSRSFARMRNIVRANCRRASREVVAQCVEEAAGAFFASGSVIPELVEEDAVLDMGELSTRVRRLEFE